MAVKPAEVESALIDSVCARIRELLPSDQANACEAFVRQYYHWVPAEDLSDREPLDLYGAALAQWKLAQHRAPGESKVRVYNPVFEQHGWASPHTVVELVTDDMPFLVDSVTMELARQGHGIDLVIHPVMRVRRDAGGRLVELLEPDESASDAQPESVLHAEVVREADRGRLSELHDGIARVLGDVEAAVRDWSAMRERMTELATELERRPPPIDEREVGETEAFLDWLVDDHFTFLGYREYKFEDAEDTIGLRALDGSGLGILSGRPATPLTALRPKALALARAPHLLVLTKANSRATVHRPAYLDYVGVKTIGEDGNVTGECRFLGLYTSAAYKQSPLAIPLLRGKVKAVLERGGFPPASHDAKALLEILETYPRDSLFQIEADELFEVAIGLLGLGERQRLRLFARRDPLDRFMACMVCVPRDRFNTENRERIGRLLRDGFGGTQTDWSIYLSESLLVRVHYIVHLPPDAPEDYDLAEIEARLVQATRAWSDDLRDALNDEHGEELGAQLFERYGTAFPPAYRADWLARSAVGDIARLEELAGTAADRGPILSLYRPAEGADDAVRCKLFSASEVALSDVLPTFENMGARVVDEHPYELTPSDSKPMWLYDFGLQCTPQDVEGVGEAFEDAFLGVWRGELENDGFNALVMRAGLTGREITVVRAIAKYLRQAGIAFSDRYMEQTLLAHPEIAALLVRLFVARFSPDDRDGGARDSLARGIEEAIAHAIDEVQSLDQDRIMRSFLSVVQAILRTNYFRPGDGDQPRPCLSFKLDPSKVPLLPLPRPRFEIFVYSPRVEGVHLRGGKVARGGLRWSDRPEDFRTEILGLMKAQMVKNALIVPVGSKGGFVVKRPPADGSREAQLDEGIACYKTFLSGLLDLTDNIVAGDVVPPPRVVRYDDDDPYLVVAADKGTATFSDIANGVSADYDFWLGDAFASGGSQGYDHKQMGITARGAWESVKRHFRELGSDIQTTDFTAVGVGDMAGDVFGNGMLLSRHIKLLAAFNHMHVFLDPNPDPEVSFEERKRLFELPRSAWSDYDGELISDGGGIYPRSAKSIPISSQVKEALGIKDDELAPTDLIRAILRAPVDLLWNGGIGTYVKASTESHADAGDKANDAVRIDASELRCRVVGEGGNLGFTQRGRIEYALSGGVGGVAGEVGGGVGGTDFNGKINTDAIDNVAGVNCSDHEVNIKILLGALVADGEMTEKQRNELLVEMTDAVGDLVLYGSYTQTQAMSLALAQAEPMVDVHQRLIRNLEQVASLNRKLEFLPSDDVIAERKAAHMGLVGPEMAVVMAYCKIHLYASLLESDLPEDPYLAHDLERYFPPPLPDRYAEQMRGHRLRREIIATVVANQLVDRAGTTFAFRLGEETGAPGSILARAYAVAREVFEMRSFWNAIEELDNEVEAKVQLEMLIEGRRLVERATRWLARANPGSINIAVTLRYFEPGAKLLASSLPHVLDSADRWAFASRVDELVGAGVPSGLAARVAGMPSLLPAFDVVEIAGVTGRSVEGVMATYFRVGSRLELNWLRDRIIELPRGNRWQALARAALRDDLSSLHRALTQEVLETGGEDAECDAAIDAWAASHGAAVKRCIAMLDDIKASRTFDTTTLPVALREVRNLIRGGAPVEGVAGAESVTMAG
jgi:glutamate dehydrogenase